MMALICSASNAFMVVVRTLPPATVCSTTAVAVSSSGKDLERLRA
jgi:hypothetical protein